MKKQKQAKVISINSSCGSQGCNLKDHEKVIPWLIKRDLKKVA